MVGGRGGAGSVPRARARAIAQRLLLALFSGLAATLSALAQTGTDGAIAGRVLSSAGTPIAGAQITARSLETGIESFATSGHKGEFVLVRLPVGSYVISVRASGLSAETSQPIRVSLGEVSEVEPHMHRSSSSPTAGTPHSLDLLSALPNGGQWRSLLLTDPAANDAATQDAAFEISFRGVDPTQNSDRTDGLSADDSFSGGRLGGGVAEDINAGTDTVSEHSAGPGTTWQSVEDGGRRAGSAYTFSQAAIREFRVHGQGDAATYGSALFGHGVGGVVTAVPRSGESRTHAMGFYNMRSSAWAATDPFAIASTYANGIVTSATVKPRDLRQQYGGSFGGPIPVAWLASKLSAHPTATDAPPHLFYFYAFDQQHRGFPAISSPGYASFYALTPNQTALLANRGVSTAKTAAALTYLASLTGEVPRSASQTVNFGRIDWLRNGGNRLIGEYNRARWSNPGGARSSPVVNRGAASLGSSFGAVDMGVARWVQFLTPRLSNELRVQYGRELQYETPQTPLPQEPAIGPGGLAPEVAIGPGGLVFGTPASLGQRAYPDERRFEAADVVVWVRGAHFLQIGADLSLLRDYTASLTNAEGTFSYDSSSTSTTAGGLVDWITDYTFNVHAYPNGGCPSINAATHDFCFHSFSQSFGQQSLTFRRQEWAAFLQDDWRVAPTLTFHAGLRYEYEFLPLPQQPNAALDALFGGVGATGIFPEDRNNLGPRLGLAWQPFGFGRGTVRVGYGLYFGKLPGATLQAALLDTATAGSVSRVRILPTTETACPQMTTVGFGYPCAFLAPPSGAVAATTSAVVLDRRFRLPAIQQGTLSVEHTLGAGVLGSLGYVMNLDRQLPNSVDINIAPSTATRVFQLQGGTGIPGVRDGEIFAVPVYTARMSPSFGTVTDVVSNVNATYHGLTAEARRGLGAARSGYTGASRGLEFRAAFTWSKSIDFGQNAGPTPRANGQFDPFHIGYDKGLSALNFPHHLVASVIWQPAAAGLPAWLRESRSSRALASGWSLSGIFTQTSGRPYSYQIFGGTRLSGGRESINGSGGSVVLPTVGRNTLRLPAWTNLDLRLNRSFALPHEGMRLAFAADAFNLTNHRNISGVQQRAFLTGTAANGITPLVFQNASNVATEGLNVQPFGTYTSEGSATSGQREIELRLRLEF